MLALLFMSQGCNQLFQFFFDFALTLRYPILGDNKITLTYCTKHPAAKFNTLFPFPINIFWNQSNSYRFSFCLVFKFRLYKHTMERHKSDTYLTRNELLHVVVANQH